MTIYHWLPAACLAILTTAPAATAAAPLRVSDFGTLQAAIDAARDGDTVIVDVDTEGAVLDKKLIIRGMPGRPAGLITGTSLANVSTGLLLDTGASGSELVDLRIRAVVGIASSTALYGLYSDGAADDVAVRGCRIEADDFGFYLVNGDDPIRGGWTVEHNTIELQGPTRFFGGSYGIAVSGKWSGMRVAHNRIRGTKPGGSPAETGGVVVILGDEVEVVQNEIAVNVDTTVSGGWADAVVLRFGTNVTVAMNDLRGCRTTRGPHGVVYEGLLGEGSDLTGLGAFDHVPSGAGPPGTFAIGGNLSSGGVGRGELSGSDVPVDELLMPR